jgi:hypothetical protein
MSLNKLVFPIQSKKPHTKAKDPVNDRPNDLPSTVGTYRKNSNLFKIKLQDIKKTYLTNCPLSSIIIDTEPSLPFCKKICKTPTAIILIAGKKALWK